MLQNTLSLHGDLLELLLFGLQLPDHAAIAMVMQNDQELFGKVLEYWLVMKGNRIVIILTLGAVTLTGIDWSVACYRLGIQADGESKQITSVFTKETVDVPAHCPLTIAFTLQDNRSDKEAKLCLEPG